MKISEVIKQLQEIQTKHGDLGCYVYDPESAPEGNYTSTPVHIGLGLDETGKVATEVTFMDYETALAFTE